VSDVYRQGWKDAVDHVRSVWNGGASNLTAIAEMCD